MFLNTGRKKSLIGVIVTQVLVCGLLAGCSFSAEPTATPEPTQDVAGTAQAVIQTSQADMEAKLAMQSTEQAQHFMQTQLSIAQTQVAQPTSTPNPAPTATPEFQPTDLPLEPSATLDERKVMDAKIKNARILLYEDTVPLGIGEWVEDTLIRMGLNYTTTADYSGDFMKYLDSGTKWDLIIIAAENHTFIQGEFWDVILEKAHQKTAVIAEVWYLDQLGGGKIKNFTDECGIAYDGNWDLAESVYWVKPEHEIFNYPNTALPLLHYNRYWQSNAGDQLRLKSGGDAEIVAGLSKYSSHNSGLVAVCMGGRTVFQTFCNHDFHRNEIMDVWENYITYTLTRHFTALEE